MLFLPIHVFIKKNNNLIKSVVGMWVKNIIILTDRKWVFKTGCLPASQHSLAKRKDILNELIINLIALRIRLPGEQGSVK